MFNIFKTKKVANPFAELGVDMHSHLIPGIDDGAKTMEDTLEMLQGLSDLGYRKVITTPHTYWELYPNTRDGLLEGLSAVQSAVNAAGIPLEVEVASEYFMDEHFEALVAKKELLTIGDSNYVLVEMSFYAPPPNLESILFELQIQGYKPIIAHPERYSFYAKDITAYKRLKDKGCLLQLNLLSLVGQYGGEVKRTAEQLLKKGWIDFVGTDMHNTSHLEALKELGQSKMWRKYGKLPFKNTAL